MPLQSRLEYFFFIIFLFPFIHLPLFFFIEKDQEKCLTTTEVTEIVVIVMGIEIVEEMTEIEVTEETETEVTEIEVIETEEVTETEEVVVVQALIETDLTLVDSMLVRLLNLF